MRVAIGSKETRWRWFTNETLGFSVELYGPTTTEFHTAMAKYGIGGSRPDLTSCIRFIADNWWRDFKDIEQASSGEPIPNTPQNRVALLEEVPVLWAYINNKIADFSSWVDEGNGGSGSDS